MPDLTILSLGAGVQSTVLYLLAARGELPLPDYAIFADTQCEPDWVYDNLNDLERAYGDTLPIRRPTAGNLQTAVENGVNGTGNRFAAVPFWVVGQDGNYAPGRRQCTREYKIDVVKREIRDILGLRPGQRAAGRFQVEEWVGISLDEAVRAKPSRYSWITSRHPLLFDRPMHRFECRAYLDSIHWPQPQKSACIFCPYRGATEYAEWKRNAPELFEEACKVDDLIRSSGTMKGMRSQQFILKDLKPLRELEDNPPDDQLDLFNNECEGMCGV